MAKAIKTEQTGDNVRDPSEDSVIPSSGTQVIKPRRKLTVKQSKFVDAYVANNGNGSDAARQAGYSLKVDGEQAYDNLRKPQIQQAIADKTLPIYTPEYLQQRLTELIRRTDLAPGSLTKALELAMRNLAMLTERNITDVTQHTTADELIVKAEQAVRQLKHDTMSACPITGITSSSNMAVHATNDIEHDASMSTVTHTHDPAQSMDQVENDPTGSGTEVEATSHAVCAHIPDVDKVADQPKEST